MATLIDTTVYGSEWRSWTSGTSATTSNDVLLVWNTWVDDLNSATTAFVSATASTVETWREWNTQIGEAAQVFRTVVVQSSETLRRVQEEQALEYARMEEERRRKEEEALQRANDLLLMHLDARQREQWNSHRHFELYSKSGKRFRIRHEYSMNVDELDADGKPVAKHCIVPRGINVPLPDQLLMQKLMLEHNEEEFVRIANRRAL